MEENGTKELYQKGAYILMILAMLTIGEFLLASVGAPWWSIFFLIAILKAYFVVMNYMHLPRLFAVDEESAE